MRQRLRHCVFFAFALLAAFTVQAEPDPGIRTRHFVFRPDPGAVGTAKRLARDAEESRSHVQSVLGIADPRIIEVAIVTDDASMQAWVGTSRPVREWIAGLAMSDRNLVVLSARGNEVFHAQDTFVHELAHIYLDAAVAGRFVPRWFHEGFAMLVASEPIANRLKSALGAAATDSLLPLETLVDRFPMDGPQVQLAYAQSMLFVRYLQRNTDGQGIASLLAVLRAGMPFEAAFVQVFGDTPERLFVEFAASMDGWGGLIVALTSAAVIWVAIMLLFLWAYVRKRARSASKREMWALQEELARMQVPGPDEVQ